MDETTQPQPQPDQDLAPVEDTAAPDSFDAADSEIGSAPDSGDDNHSQPHGEADDLQAHGSGDTPTGPPPAPPTVAPLEPPPEPTPPPEPDPSGPSEIVPPALADAARSDIGLIEYIDEATGMPPDVTKMFKPATDHGTVMISQVRLIERKRQANRRDLLTRLVMPKGSRHSMGQAERLVAAVRAANPEPDKSESDDETTTDE